MAPISLKIILDDGAVTRTIQFESGCRVSDAHDIIKEKLPTGDDGKDYGLFLTSADDSRSGIWLEDYRTLEYYMLRNGDSLLYLKLQRNLRIRMLDGSVKTLQVDETKNIGELMKGICDKIGISNHDEYGLCHEELEEPEEPKESKPATGTLTLKRKVQQKERDAKMEQLSKKLKTDDNVEWLDHHKTLREMGVNSKETLLLKRRLFYSDRNVDSRDPVQLNLLYVQTRDAILDGRHPVTETQAQDCKVRWINIRDVNRRMLRKSASNPGQRNKQYKYENELAFMRPFYKDVTMPSGELDTDENRRNYDQDRNDIDEEDGEDTTEIPANDSDESESDDSETPIKIITTKTSKTKRKRKRNTEEETVETAAFTESLPLSELNPSDPLDAFLLSIGATLKTFSSYHLNLAKTKIFAVVQEHELQQIVQKQREEESIDVKVSTSRLMYQQ